MMGVAFSGDFSTGAWEAIAVGVVTISVSILVEVGPTGIVVSDRNSGLR